MDKKNYLWIIIGVIAIVIALLLVIKTADKKKVNVPEVNNTETGVYTGGATINTETGLIKSGEGEVINQVSTTSLTEAIPLATESIIKVESQTFTPKTIRVKSGGKVFITLSSQDDASHTFGFIDDALSFIIKSFDKAGGDQSITFPAPVIGTYTYYVDDKTNTGKLIIE